MRLRDLFGDDVGLDARAGEVAVAGLAVNLIVFFMLRGGAQDSLAVRGAYVDAMADAAGSVGVIVAAIVISKRRSTSLAESGPSGAESASGPGSPKSEGEGDEAESGDNGKESADTAAA